MSLRTDLKLSVSNSAAKGEETMSQHATLDPGLPQRTTSEKASTRTALTLQCALVLAILSISAVGQSSQQATSLSTNDPGLPAIHGQGSSNYLAKFLDAHNIGNSAISESGGNIFTRESFTAGAIWGRTSDLPGVGVEGLNLTTNGGTSQDASFFSGIHGVDGSTNSPAGVGVFGTSTATVGDPIGVFGYTSSTHRGIGVRGHSNATTGFGLGVLGESNSINGTDVIGVNGSPSGFSPIGIFGYVLSADGGIGVLGRAWSNTGFGSGIRGESLSPNGVGGLFENKAGGNIIYGMNAGVTKFRVDGQGTVYADGGFQPYGADFAESMLVTGTRDKYSPGDLLAIDATARQRLVLTQQPYSTLVAGIYSTKPGVL